MIDIVIVYHRESLLANIADIWEALEHFSPGRVKLYPESNCEVNRGFSRACNQGAARGSEPVIGFLNPDIIITGDIVIPVVGALKNADVTGDRFGKPERELRAWGCADWVCGAAMFVSREWWNLLNGFDEGFVWSHEETDFCYRTQRLGGKVRSLDLPLEHVVMPNHEDDIAYKHHWHEEGRALYRKKWGLRA